MDGEETETIVFKDLDINGDGEIGKEGLKKFFNDTSSIYTGERQNGKKHGRGVQVWPYGDIYVGKWENDQANGMGTMDYADGDIY